MKKRGPGRPKGSKNKPKVPIVQPFDPQSTTPILGLTKTGAPRKRREKLHPALRKIEHNMLMHIKKDVRHCGRGWVPLYLDPAWDAALKRMLKDGIILERPDLGGYVPAEFVRKMELQNAAVLNQIKSRFKTTKRPVPMANLGREAASALGRLVISGQVDFDPTTGYSPLEG